MPLLLYVLVPLQGFAQDPWAPPPLVTAPAMPEEGSSEAQTEPSAEAGPPEGELIPHQWAPARTPASSGGRITISAVVATSLGAVAVIPGGLMLLDAAFCEDCNDTGDKALRGLGLAFAGLSIVPALGIFGMGSLMGGEGRFLPTLGGTLLGSLAGVALGVITLLIAGPLAILPLLACPVIGGIISYENSHEAVVLRPERALASAQMVPLVSVTPLGGLVAGLAGRF